MNGDRIDLISPEGKTCTAKVGALFEMAIDGKKFREWRIDNPESVFAFASEIEALVDFACALGCGDRVAFRYCE